LTLLSAAQVKRLDGRDCRGVASWAVHLPKLLMMARLIRPRPDSRLYQHLWELDAGFSQVRSALNGIQRNPGFDARELARFSALVAEARAASLSYLLDIIGESESKEAGSLFKIRRGRERMADRGNKG
jgi:hypothetical protein